MRQRWVWGVIAILLAVGLAGCGLFKRDQITAEQAAGPALVAVETLPVSMGQFMEAVDVVGSLDPKREAFVKAEFQAVVAQVYVTEWVQVRKGQPLAKLDTSETEVMRARALTQVEVSKALLLKAEVAANRANREYERLMKLKEVGLVTEQNLDDARTQKEAAEADIKAAQSQIKASEDDVRQVETRLEKSLLRAPMEGVVAMRRPNTGDLVGDPTSSEPLFRIVDSRVLLLNLEVPSSRLSQVRIGQPIKFETEALPGKSFTGKISFINPAADSSSRSVKVQAEVANPTDELRPGLFVKGQILTGNQSQQLQVPKTALLTWDVAAGQGELFVLDGEYARRRRVQTGRVSNEMVEIISGVSTGQSVITRGAFNVRDGDRVKVAKSNGA